MKINEKIVGEPEEVIKNNLRLVWKAVYKYKAWLRRVHGVEMDDLYSVGCIGLIKAYEIFDPEKGIQKFEHYAFRRICSNINKFIYEYNDTLSFPRRAREVYYKLYKNNLLDKTPKEIMEAINMTLSDILIGLEYSKWKCISTNVSIANNEGAEELTIEDLLISNDNKDNNISIKEIFDMMDDRDKQILYLYYYKDYTTTQISKVIGIGQPNVSRRLKKIGNLINEYNKAI